MISIHRSLNAGFSKSHHTVQSVTFAEAHALRFNPPGFFNEMLHPEGQCTFEYIPYVYVVADWQLGCALEMGQQSLLRMRSQILIVGQGRERERLARSTRDRARHKS